MKGDKVYACEIHKKVQNKQIVDPKLDAHMIEHTQRRRSGPVNMMSGTTRMLTTRSMATTPHASRPNAEFPARAGCSQWPYGVTA